MGRRAAGLISPHVGEAFGGHGLNHREIATVFRAAGYSTLGPIALNIMAPDEGNMALLEKVAAPDAPGRTLLTEATERLKLSARGYHRVLRVARTLADLEAAPMVRRVHVAEALAYRRLMPM